MRCIQSFLWGREGVGDVDLFDWHITYKHFNMDTLQLEDHVTFPLVQLYNIFENT